MLKFDIAMFSLILGGGTIYKTYDSIANYGNVKLKTFKLSREDMGKPYSASAAFDLFDDMINSSLLKDEFIDGSVNGVVANGSSNLVQDNSNEFLSQEEIKTEVISYLNRLDENNVKLSMNYRMFYGNNKKTPDVILKILNNKISYHKTKEKTEFYNKYQIDDVYSGLFKYKPKDSNQKNKLSKQLIKQMPSINAQNSHVVLSAYAKSMPFELGSYEMRLGLLLDFINRDMLNNILTNCSIMGIDVNQIINPEERKKQKTKEVISIGDVDYILSQEPSSIVSNSGKGM